MAERGVTAAAPRDERDRWTTSTLAKQDTNLRAGPCPSRSLVTGAFTGACKREPGN